MFLIHFSLASWLNLSLTFTHAYSYVGVIDVVASEDVSTVADVD